MNTKVLYVLVSTDEDIFAEQTYLSVLTLKEYNKNASVALIMDDATCTSLKNRKFDLLAQIDEPIVVNLPAGLTNKYKSRILKTSMRNHVQGDVLYIDSDTIILSDLSDIDSNINDIAAVNELNRPFTESTSKKTLTEIYARLGENINKIEYYYNSGVIYIKDNERTKTFFSEWKELWEEGTKKGIFFDQPSLGLINYKKGNVISQMDGIWNCQGRYSVNYAKGAKIFHYLYDQGFEFPLLNKEVFSELKDKGIVSDRIKNILKNPYGSISTNNIIITDDDVILFGSKLYSLIRSIYRHKWIYKSLEGTLNKTYSIFLYLKSRKLAPPR